MLTTPSLEHEDLVDLLARGDIGGPDVAPTLALVLARCTASHRTLT